MKTMIRSLLLGVMLMGFGAAGAADSSSGGLSICFAPSEFPGSKNLVEDLSWRANCIWNQLVTM